MGEMTTIKYGPVLTYKDTEEARALIGKKVVCSDNLAYIEQAQNSAIILMDVREESDAPFVTADGCNWQFIREAIEEPVFMTYRQLAEWLAKGNGQFCYQSEGACYHEYDYFRECDNDYFNDDIRIRYWDSDEWLTPTLDIYERDCGGEND